MPSASSMSARSASRCFRRCRLGFYLAPQTAGADLPADFRRLPAGRAVEHPGGAGRFHRRKAISPPICAACATSIASATQAFQDAAAKRLGGLLDFAPFGGGIPCRRQVRAAAPSTRKTCRTQPSRPGSSSRRSAASASSRSPNKGLVLGVSAIDPRGIRRGVEVLRRGAWNGIKLTSPLALSSRIIAAPFSATINVGALVFPEVTFGKIEASMTRSPPCRARAAGGRQPHRAGRVPCGTCRRHERRCRRGRGCRRSSSASSVDGGARLHLVVDQLAHRRLRGDPPDQAHAGEQLRHVFGRRQIVGLDDRRARSGSCEPMRIGRGFSAGIAKCR